MSYSVLHNKSSEEVLELISKHFSNLKKLPFNQFRARLSPKFHGVFPSEENYILFELSKINETKENKYPFELIGLNNFAKTKYSNFFKFFVYSEFNESSRKQEINLKNVDSKAVKDSKLVRLVKEIKGEVIFNDELTYKRAFVMDYVAQKK